MHLGAEHTAAFVRQALDAGSYVVCHQTLTYGDHPDFGPAAVGFSTVGAENLRHLGRCVLWTAATRSVSGWWLAGRGLAGRAMIFGLWA
jgi:hypothetical protein